MAFRLIDYHYLAGGGDFAENLRPQLWGSCSIGTPNADRRAHFAPTPSALASNDAADQDNIISDYDDIITIIDIHSSSHSNILARRGQQTAKRANADSGSGQSVAPVRYALCLAPFATNLERRRCLAAGGISALLVVSLFVNIG